MSFPQNGYVDIYSSLAKMNVPLGLDVLWDLKDCVILHAACHFVICSKRRKIHVSVAS